MYRRTGAQSHCLLPPAGAPTLAVFSQWKGIKRNEREGNVAWPLRPWPRGSCVSAASQLSLHRHSSGSDPPAFPTPAFPHPNTWLQAEWEGDQGGVLAPLVRLCVLSHFSCV